MFAIEAHEGVTELDGREAVNGQTDALAATTAVSELDIDAVTWFCEPHNYKGTTGASVSQVARGKKTGENDDCHER